MASTKITDRIDELVALYGAPDACVAELLCDQHPADNLAYKMVGPDLSAVDLTYGALRAQSERFAAALSDLGVGPGDRVATLMGKSTKFLVTLLAIWRLGAVYVPIFTAFAPPAIAFRLLGSAAKIVVCDGAQQPKLRPGGDMPADLPWTVVTTADAGSAGPGMLLFGALMAGSGRSMPPARLGGDAPMIHIYTSGTTGTPKGVIVPTRALAGFRAYAEFGLNLLASDLFWCAADPGWAYGLYYAVLGPLATGTPTLLLRAGFDAATTFEVLSRFGVTNFAAAPTVYRSLRMVHGDVPAITALRHASSAGEPLTPEVNDWAVGALGVTVHDHYGQTETGMLINNHHQPDLAGPIQPGSMGVAMPGWSMLVLKDGEDVPADAGELGRVAVDLKESPFAWFSGYAGTAESAGKFAGDGRWYITGDAGRRSAEGYYVFSSRDDDVIIMAGYRIGPFEIESIIVTHPGVGECAAIAVPDSVRGEVLETYVVLRPGVPEHPGLVKEIQDLVKTRYAAHAFPRQVHFVDALPKTASGKVQRFLLRQRRRDEMAAPATAPA